MNDPSGLLEYLPLTLKEEQLEEFDGDDLSSTQRLSIAALQLFSLCRVCAEPSTNMVAIFSDVGKQLQLSEKIQLHLPINIKRDDALPLQMCINCVLKLDSFHQMAAVCLDADKKLRSYFNETQSYSLESEPSAFSEQEDTGNNSIVFETYSLDESLLLIEDSVTQDSDYYKETQDSNLKTRKTDKAKRDLVCVLCQTSICGTTTLIEHHLVVHGKHMCQRCGRLFADEGVLLQHVQASHMLKCWCCDSFFRKDAQLVLHFKEVHEGKQPYYCEPCNEDFPTLNLLFSHKKTHKNKKIFTCHTCSKSFKLKDQLNRHIITHLPSNEKNKKLCSECGKSYSTEYKLKCHMRRHTGELPYKCDECPKAFHILGTFKLHQLVHKKEKNFTCDLCGASYFHRRNLDDHKNAVHVGSWEYKCKVCDETFKSEPDIVFHITTHKDSEVRKYSPSLFIKISDFKCECGKYLRNKSLLTAHKRRHNNSSKPYYQSSVNTVTRIHKNFTCETCGKNLSCKLSLKIHLRTHMAVKPFVCNICSKGFICKVFLDDHMRTHTGEQPFVCKFCAMKFHRKSNCSKHQRAVHLNLKPYVCATCGKAYKTNSSLAMHTRIHTGEKRYVCDICDRAFTQKTDMRRHKARHAVTEQGS